MWELEGCETVFSAAFRRCKLQKQRFYNGLAPEDRKYMRGLNLGFWRAPGWTYGMGILAVFACLAIQHLGIRSSQLDCAHTGTPQPGVPDQAWGQRIHTHAGVKTEKDRGKVRAPEETVRNSKAKVWTTEDFIGDSCKGRICAKDLSKYPPKHLLNPPKSCLC